MMEEFGADYRQILTLAMPALESVAGPDQTPALARLANDSMADLVARLPRCRCPDHGVKTIVPPWAGKHSRFTLFFEAFAIEVLQACRTVKAAAALLGLSWDAAQTIMDRAVERGLERREGAIVKSCVQGI
jgi:hypothetical protein